jgi:hypothetical protein
VVLRYEQILHTLQTAADDGKKYTAELNATMGRGSKSARDLIKIIFADSCRRYYKFPSQSPWPPR